jgi:hypothetical protein
MSTDNERIRRELGFQLVQASLRIDAAIPIEQGRRTQLEACSHAADAPHLPRLPEFSES